MQTLNQKQTYKSIWQITRLMLFYCISYFYYGYSLVYFNSIPYSAIQKIFVIQFQPVFAQGFLTGTISIGGIIGAITLKPVLYFFSRKHGIYFFNVMALCGGILVLIRDPYTLMLGRIIQGFCSGGLSGQTCYMFQQNANSCQLKIKIFMHSLISIIMKELCPIQIYGIMGGLVNIQFAFGTTFGFLLSYLFVHFNISSQVYWFYVFCFPFVILLLQQILFLTHFHNQTPKYLLIKGRAHQARQIIQQIYLPEFHDQIYHQYLKNLESDLNYLEGQEREYPPDHWRAVFIALFIAFMLQFSGGHMLLVYAIEIIDGFMPGYSAQMSIYLNCVLLIATIVNLYILKRFSRRFLMIQIVSILSLSLFCIFLGFSIKSVHGMLGKVIILTSFFVYVFALAFSIISVIWLYIPEVVQPRIVAVTTAIIWLMGGVATILFPLIRTSCGNPDCPIIFFVLSFFMALEAVVCYFFLVETKDKTELEIRELFNSGKVQ